MHHAHAVLVALALATTAQAGAPLICHPFAIDDAASLPAPAGDKAGTGEAYDTSRLSADTLARLTPAAPVLVRMETLRRAVLHGDREHAQIRELFHRLERRVDDAESRGGDALALFDLGYLAETYRQRSWSVRRYLEGTDFDGYALVERALALRRSDPEMAFAAAIIASHPERPRRHQHLRAALDGAAEGSLLARNLVSHFGRSGDNLQAMRVAANERRP